MLIWEGTSDVRAGSGGPSNAGHTSPYIDGKEILAGPGLPLGISSDQHYALVTGVLRADQKIVALFACGKAADHTVPWDKHINECITLCATVEI